MLTSKVSRESSDIRVGESYIFRPSKEPKSKRYGQQVRVLPPLAGEAHGKGSKPFRIADNPEVFLVMFQDGFKLGAHFTELSPLQE